MIRPTIFRLWGLYTAFSDELSSRHIFLLAAGIAFNALLCLIPIVLVLFWIFGSITDPQVLSGHVRHYLDSLLPINVSSGLEKDKIVREIERGYAISTGAGYVGVLLLWWTASAFFSSLRTGLNVVIASSRDRSFVSGKIKDLVATIVLLVLFVALVLVSPAIHVIATFGSNLLPDFLRGIVNSLIPPITDLVVTLLFFAFVYGVVPDTKPKRWHLFISIVLATILWELARLLFGYYLSFSNSMGTLYGTYAVIVLPALWTYYSILVVLLSALFTRVLFQSTPESLGTST